MASLEPESTGVPDLPVCQHTSFLAAWYLSTSVWYALAALWIGLSLWPSRRRAGQLLGTIVVLGTGAMLHMAFKQTFHCVLVDASGHTMAGGRNPFENPRAFPSLEGALATYLAVVILVPHRHDWLPRASQRSLAVGLLGVVWLSLLWFHTPVQILLSLLLGLGVGVAWLRLIDYVLRRLGTPSPDRSGSSTAV